MKIGDEGIGFKNRKQYTMKESKTVGIYVELPFQFNKFPRV